MLTEVGRVLIFPQAVLPSACSAQAHVEVPPQNNITHREELIYVRPLTYIISFHCQNPFEKGK